MTREGLPLEQFIQALASQLDSVQETMAVKARAGMPMTFAVKDLTLDLRAHVDMAGSAVHIRPAGPTDAAASTIHVALTTITRPMIEENTRPLTHETGEPSLQDVLGEDMTDDDRRRLEWAGIRNVAQLRQVQRSAGSEVIGRVSSLPVDRLRAALEVSTQPRVRRVETDREHTNGTPALRIRGENLVAGGVSRVRVDGVPARIRLATPQELVVEPDGGALFGVLEVETADDSVHSVVFDARDDDSTDTAEEGAS